MKNKGKRTILAPWPDTWYEVINKLYHKECIAITFQVTEDCCMACTYCYQHNKSNNKMTFETAKTFIDKLFDGEFDVDLASSQTLIFEFIGGEPLMEIKLIDQICDYTLMKMIKLHHPWLLNFKASICTNGLLYFTPDVQSFLKKYSNFVDISFSVDGNKELHDSCRLDRNGFGTYDRVMQAVYHYREHYGIKVNTKMTVSPDNVRYLYDAIIGLINNGFTEIFVNCIFEKGWTNEHATILYNELKKIADYLIDNDLYNKNFIRFFDESIYCPLDENDNENWCGGTCDDGKMVFSVDYKGDIYPCIRYMASSLNGRQKPLKVGDIRNGYGYSDEDKENMKLLSNITRRSQSTNECFYCPIAKGCAWCSAYNYEEFGTPNKRATYICIMHKAASLANVYLLNTLYKKLSLAQHFPMHLPKEQALNIIDEDEYNYLFNLSQE